MTLGARLRAQVEDSFAGQAAEYGRKLHARAVELRSRDPLATFLMDTFARQVRARGERAEALQAAGDHAHAVEQASAALVASENLARVRAAVEGAQ